MNQLRKRNGLLQNEIDVIFHNPLIFLLFNRCYETTNEIHPNPNNHLQTSKEISIYKWTFLANNQSRTTHHLQEEEHLEEGKITTNSSQLKIKEVTIKEDLQREEMISYKYNNQHLMKEKWRRQIIVLRWNPMITKITKEII